MMKKRILLSLSTALGLLFCSFTAQAMENEEDRPANHIAKLKKDMYVFDCWAFNEITSKLFGTNFPKDLLDYFGKTIVNSTEDLFNCVSKMNARDFYSSLCLYDGVHSFAVKAMNIHCYKEYFFLISKDVAHNFCASFKFKHAESPIQMIHFKHPEYFYEYIVPKTGNKLSFSITLLSSDYANQQKNYALSCFKNLDEIEVGNHVIDYYRTRKEYFTANPCDDEWAEWSWLALRLSDYQLYDRRMEYEFASEERKEEMLEEKEKFRKKLEKGLET